MRFLFLGITLFSTVLIAVLSEAQENMYVEEEVVAPPSFLGENRSLYAVPDKDESEVQLAPSSTEDIDGLDDDVEMTENTSHWELYRYFNASFRLLNKRNDIKETVSRDYLREARFGDITVLPRACAIIDSPKFPEQAVFLDVLDKNLDLLFSGWMFAQRPAAVALEDPIYDVAVISCKPIEPIVETQQDVSSTSF